MKMEGHSNLQYINHSENENSNKNNDYFRSGINKRWLIHYSYTLNINREFILMIIIKENNV